MNVVLCFILIRPQRPPTSAFSALRFLEVTLLLQRADWADEKGWSSQVSRGVCMPSCIPRSRDVPDNEYC